MQTIELFIKDESEDGVFAISLVDEPAIESDFLALSKQDNNKFNINLKEVDKKRKVVVGYALIPDLKIPRYKDGKEFNIVMSKETVALAAKLYMSNLNGANVTSQHEKPVQGCCVIESWIVEDAKNDKANIYNLEPAPKGGEWVVMMSLTDEEYSKVEDGEYNGFSIEAMFQGFDALEQSKELTEDELIEKIKELLK
jgi:hypothetical protein|tara:strand:+ start:394 stop:984 length:591 start_codon:yes stop_codon:yes gene_type:complete